MKSNPENRDNTRFPHVSTVTYEDLERGIYSQSKMYNYSDEGLYFESDFAPKVGAEIFIGVENSPFTSGHDVYRAKVIWKKELPDKQSFFFYGVGVKYF